jgi:hypothetical protein
MYFNFISRFSSYLTENTLSLYYEDHLVNQYSETNVMHLLFSVLRIKGLYTFQALHSHPQEVLHKRHLVYCVSVMSVGSTILVQPTDITLK